MRQEMLLPGLGLTEESAEFEPRKSTSRLEQKGRKSAATSLLEKTSASLDVLTDQAIELPIQFGGKGVVINAKSYFA